MLSSLIKKIIALFVGTFLLGSTIFYFLLHDFYEAAKKIVISSLKLKDSHEYSDIDFRLTCKYLEKVIDSSESIQDIEIDIINSFENL